MYSIGQRNINFEELFEVRALTNQQQNVFPLRTVPLEGDVRFT